MFYKFRCTATFVSYIGISAVSADIAKNIVTELFNGGEVDAHHIEDEIELVGASEDEEE